MNSLEFKSLKMSILGMCRPKKPIETDENSEILLAKNMTPRREVWENLGFKFEEAEEDSVVCEAKLPEGWTIVPIETYKYEIKDANNLTRATMDYNIKVNTASMRLVTRYAVHSVSRKVGKDVENLVTNTVVYFGTKTEKIFVAGELTLEDSCSDAALIKYHNALKDLVDMANEYAYKYYPDWKNLMSYWDEETQKVYTKAN